MAKSQTSNTPLNSEEEDNVQLEFPIETLGDKLSSLPQYESLEKENLYELSRQLDGAIIKDSYGIIPPVFPKRKKGEKEAEFTRKLVWKSGYIKSYTLKGDFKSTDQSDIIMLTAYWRTYDGKNKTFDVFIPDYLRFSNKIPNHPKNIANFKDFLIRMDRNSWKANCWRDYSVKGKFYANIHYSLCREPSFKTFVDNDGNTFDLVTITWSNYYFERINTQKNWKNFDLDAFCKLPHQGNYARNLLIFLGNEDNHYIKHKGDHLLCNIKLHDLCNFYLGLPEKQYPSRYKAVLKKTLESLKNIGSLSFEDYSECFYKIKKTWWFTCKYIPRNLISSITSHAKPVQMSYSELFFHDLITSKSGLLKELSLTLPSFENNWLKKPLDHTSFDFKNLAYNLSYAVWGAKTLRSGEPLIKNPKHVFQVLMKIIQGEWNIDTNFYLYWNEEVEPDHLYFVSQKEAENNAIEHTPSNAEDSSTNESFENSDIIQDNNSNQKLFKADFLNNTNDERFEYLTQYFVLFPEYSEVGMDNIDRFKAYLLEFVFPNAVDYKSLKKDAITILNGFFTHVKLINKKNSSNLRSIVDE